jgi:hypothetical protein
MLLYIQRCTRWVSQSTYYEILKEILNCVLFRASASAFSPDVSLIAAGFNESYIRLWNLKGEKLRGMRSDFDPADAKDGTHIPPILTSNTNDHLQFEKFGRNKGPQHENSSDILGLYTPWHLTRLAAHSARQSTCSLVLLT